MSTYWSNVIMALMLAMSIFAIQLTNCQSYQPIFGNKRHEGSAVTQYCGHHLSNALQLICEGKYNPMFKKNGQLSQLDDYADAYDYPLRSRASANAMMGRFGGGRFRRQSRGVHDECCMKPCSISELKSYCG